MRNRSLFHPFAFQILGMLRHAALRNASTSGDTCAGSILLIAAKICKQLVSCRIDVEGAEFFAGKRPEILLPAFWACRACSLGMPDVTNAYALQIRGQYIDHPDLRLAALHTQHGKEGWLLHASQIQHRGLLQASWHQGLPISLTTPLRQRQ